MEQRNNEFTFRRVATNGCEVHDPSGVVIAWTANELWAAIITHLLNNDGSAAETTPTNGISDQTLLAFEPISVHWDHGRA